MKALNKISYVAVLTLVVSLALQLSLNTEAFAKGKNRAQVSGVNTGSSSNLCNIVSNTSLGTTGSNRVTYLTTPNACINYALAAAGGIYSAADAALLQISYPYVNLATSTASNDLRRDLINRISNGQIVSSTSYIYWNGQLIWAQNSAFVVRQDFLSGLYSLSTTYLVNAGFATFEQCTASSPSFFGPCTKITHLIQIQ